MHVQIYGYAIHTDQKSGNSPEVTIIAELKQHMGDLVAAQRGTAALLALTPSLEGEKLEHIQKKHSRWIGLLNEMQVRWRIFVHFIALASCSFHCACIYLYIRLSIKK